ncbi:hypothetical protein PIB30_040953 [Stylosanthes scabra]|uniref:Uncharacterized protein n=1 Tax=Stylosanthes scabra TaxID=79078 RepID=A0ABU6REY1_9FABA|nr:hypothetical protein [Stylosanthes scabra]
MATFGPRSQREPSVTHSKTWPSSLRATLATFGPRLGQTWLNKASCKLTKQNRRDKQLLRIDPEIEKTLTKNRNMVRFHRALQGSPSLEEIFVEEIQDNMGNDNNNNQWRTLGDFIVPTTVSYGSSIVRPVVDANNFELKLSLIQLVQQE